MKGKSSRDLGVGRLGGYQRSGRHASLRSLFEKGIACMHRDDSDSTKVDCKGVFGAILQCSSQNHRWMICCKSFVLTGPP